MSKRVEGILSKKKDGSFEYQIINEWQLCPKCNGVGQMYNNVYVQTTAALLTCDLCNGKKIISKVNGQPPEIYKDEEL